MLPDKDTWTVTSGKNSPLSDKMVFVKQSRFLHDLPSVHVFAN